MPDFRETAAMSDARATLRINFGPDSSLSDLVEKLGDLANELKTALELATELLPIKDLKILEASIGFAKTTGRSGVSDGHVVGLLTLPGGITLHATVAFTGGKLSQPSITLKWPADEGPHAAFSLSDLLVGLGAPFRLPEALDLTFNSLSLSYDAVADAAKLSPKDTHRLVLRSPAAPAAATFVMCRSFDSDGKGRMVLRAERGEISLSGLPVIGDHLPIKLAPLLLLVMTAELKISELAALAQLSDCPGLETLGEPTANLSNTIAAGIHCATIVDVTTSAGTALHDPFHFPLYSFATKAPTHRSAAATTEPENLPEARKTKSLTAQKSIGPVHLNKVGFRFENGVISVLLDAGIKTGGFDLELIGLAIGFDIKALRPVFDIDGLLIAFSAGGVSVDGGLVRTKDGDTEWVGTALVKVGESFALEALGAFSESSPKKLFLFAYDHQQLGGPPWFVITGIALGFGYNRGFNIPAVDQVNKFPFISIANDLSQGKTIDPQPWAMMKRIQGCLPEKVGSDFVTIGVTGTSFGLANTTALLTIVFGSSIEFVILGSSSISVPKGSTPIAHAEIEIVASVQPDAGLVAIDGLLAPGSYVLDKSCTLTGGFAYHAWFTGAHAGDFVLSFGGYGPSYDRPSHYPAVPRLGFTWKISDEVLVSGWNYFALTPSSVQAGGGLQINLDAGPLHVWCHAQADFFVSWMPFHYSIALSIDIGITFRLDLFFFTITISIDISADLEIWGPPFSGHAEVHLWFVSFGFGFGGNASHDPPAVGWNEFVKGLVVPQQEQKPSLRAVPLVPMDTVPGSALSDQPVQIIAIAGLRGPPKGSAVDWLADPAHAELTVVTSIPAAHADGVPFAKAVPDGLKIKAVPLQGSPEINPTLTVTLSSTESWSATPMIGQVAGAMWGDGPTGDRLVQALTGIRLSILPTVPGQTQWIEQSILLVDIQAAAAKWEAPQPVDGGAFDWDRHGPFATMQPDRIQSHLAGMVADGYLAQDALDRIRLDFIKPGQPCFMAKPVLCRLGAE